MTFDDQPDNEGAVAPSLTPGRYRFTCLRREMIKSHFGLTRAVCSRELRFSGGCLRKNRGFGVFLSLRSRVRVG